MKEQGINKQGNIRIGQCKIRAMNKGDFEMNPLHRSRPNGVNPGGL